jgi:hypothetical protein
MQLPLPYLKVGYLTAPPANSAIAPHKDWERLQFILNHEGLQQVTLPMNSFTFCMWFEVVSSVMMFSTK